MRASEQHRFGPMRNPARGGVLPLSDTPTPVLPLEDAGDALLGSLSTDELIARIREGAQRETQLMRIREQLEIGLLRAVTSLDDQEGLSYFTNV